MVQQKNARRKGRDFEKRVCALIRESLGLTEDDIRPAPASIQGRDLQLSERGKILFPYSVECKNTKSLSIWAALEQAKRNADDLVPALIFHRSSPGNKEVWVCLPIQDFLELVDRS